ncbi:anthranilate synthase component I family protein [Cryobacterium sp. SO1]|uniref:anthranilate synthase component I family protein n=1 Tax=Cryobacterium sp. SO1 TaxID=1897061 RepID=UPI0010DA17A0|nr:anthranilate synthase component I family protein [Cryobacterium sp. SO1]RZI33919.1 Aminodeoxychorismate synthase component 1 [Cryobacterium sp. SO1]
MPTTPSHPDRGLPVRSEALQDLRSVPLRSVPLRSVPLCSVPLRSVALPHWLDPAEAFDRLFAESPYAIWLDAGADARSGVSYLAGAHHGSRLVTVSARAGTVTCSRPMDPATAPVTSVGTIFDFLRSEQGSTTQAADAPDDVGFRLGWVGWFGYGLARPGRASDGLPDGAPPDAALLFVDRAIAFDHAAHTVTLLAGSTTGEAGNDVEDWLLSTARRLGEQAAAPTPARPQASAEPLEVRWRHDETQYARLIDACQRRIAAGDAYQLCLTNEVTVAGSFDPLTVYRQLRAGSPSHHGGLLRFGAHALLSASPEEFLSVSPRGRLRTRPIKGTRPRSADSATDRMLAEELLASDKERAENLMIVDLMRNDLGRVAALGSVAVTSLLQVESYPHVHQLVSTVEARLAPGLTGIDAIEAAFPAGSMTGAPKASAMAILAALEGGDRGIYAGAFGYLGSDGTVDLAMVIRSIVLGPAGASIGTGGGITALSVPAEEIEETRIKARALISAIRASGGGPAPARGRGLVT